MILVVSTSHAISSVALIEANHVVMAAHRESPRAASSACLDMLTEVDLASIDQGFVADIGPGSFTGIKVGVMMAKMFGWLHGLPVAGVSSFDLISTEESARVAAKRGEYWIRKPAGAPELVRDPDFDPSSLMPPLAERAVSVVHELTWTQPELLVPAYLSEPSISKPNRPYREASPCP